MPPSTAFAPSSSTTCEAELWPTEMNSTSISVKIPRTDRWCRIPPPASRRRGAAPQALRVHQQKHRRGIGGRDHGAHRSASVQFRSSAYLATGAVISAVSSTPAVASTIEGASTARCFETVCAGRHRTGSAPVPPIPPDRWCAHRRTAPCPDRNRLPACDQQKNTSSNGAPKRSASSSTECRPSPEPSRAEWLC